MKTFKLVFELDKRIDESLIVDERKNLLSSEGVDMFVEDFLKGRPFTYEARDPSEYTNSYELKFQVLEEINTRIAELESIAKDARCLAEQCLAWAKEQEILVTTEIEKRIMEATEKYK